MNRIKTDLKNQVSNFISNLNEIAPREDRPKLALLSLAVSSTEEDKIMDFIINKILPHKDNIINKNETFFLNNTNTFFGNNYEKHVNYIKELYFSGKINKKDRDTIFVYFEIFVSYAQAYIDLKKIE